jgi:hypothetical protein
VPALSAAVLPNPGNPAAVERPHRMTEHMCPAGAATCVSPFELSPLQSHRPRLLRSNVSLRRRATVSIACCSIRAEIPHLRVYRLMSFCNSGSGCLGKRTERVKSCGREGSERSRAPCCAPALPESG